MHILNSSISNLRRLNDKVFALVTFDTEKGPIHVESVVVPKTEQDQRDPTKALIEKAKTIIKGYNKQAKPVLQVTAHEMLMSRVA